MDAKVAPPQACGSGEVFADVGQGVDAAAGGVAFQPGLDGGLVVGVEGVFIERAAVFAVVGVGFTDLHAGEVEAVPFGGVEELAEAAGDGVEKKDGVLHFAGFDEHAAAKPKRRP